MVARGYGVVVPGDGDGIEAVVIPQTGRLLLWE